MKKFYIVVALAVTLLTAQTALASLIANGDFETSNYSGWNVNPTDGSIDVYSSSTFAHTGTYGLYMATSNSLGSISQTVATTSGQLYDLSFYWYSFNDSSPPDQFQVSWNGNNLYDVTGPPASTFAPLNFSVTGTGSDTLTFSARNNSAFFAIDDVTLTAATAVPEPSTYALLCISLGVVGYARKKMLKSEG